MEAVSERRIPAFEYDGAAVCRLMRKAKVSVKELAGRMGRTQQWVRELRKAGFTSARSAWAWMGAIAEATPLYVELYECVERTPEILQGYQDDLLVHDKQLLEAAQVGDEFIWLGRKNGTVAMKKGWCCPEEITYWINADLVMVYLHMRVTRRIAGIAFGEVTYIDAKEARRLAEQFALHKAAA